MNISKDLFLAILSMDAYNRGYGAGLADGGTGDTDGLGEDKVVGNATIISRESLGIDSNDYDEWQAAGFYAVAYDTEYGTVISYRGTDFSPFNDLTDDVTEGWFIGGGDYTADQALLSTEFLAAVQPDDQKSSIILTGHSLGGGLAGFNSRLFGNEAVIFDNMPYLLAVDHLVHYYSSDPDILDPFNPIATLSSGIISAETAREIAEQIYRRDLSPIPEEQFESRDVTLLHNATGYYLPGEALDTLVEINIVRDQDSYPWVETAGETDGSTNVSHTPFGSFGPSVNLHSIAALILQMFSDEKGYSENWLPLHEQVFTAWFSEAIAEAIRPDNLSNYPEGFDSSTLLTCLAYSALDDGSLVFGNTGIRAMFDDLNELGRIYTSGNRDQFLDEESFLVRTSGGNSYKFSESSLKDVLTRAVVEYAGALALNKVEWVAAAQNAHVDPLMGVIAVSPDETTFALDLSSVLWRDVLQTGAYEGSDKIEFIDQDQLLARYLEQVPQVKSFWNWFSGSEEVTTETLDQLAAAHWQASDRRIFDRNENSLIDDVSELFGAPDV